MFFFVKLIFSIISTTRAEPGGGAVSGGKSWTVKARLKSANKRLRRSDGLIRPNRVGHTRWYMADTTRTMAVGRRKFRGNNNSWCFECPSGATILTVSVNRPLNIRLNWRGTRAIYKWKIDSNVYRPKWYCAF